MLKSIRDMWCLCLFQLDWIRDMKFLLYTLPQLHRNPSIGIRAIGYISCSCSCLNEIQYLHLNGTIIEKHVDVFLFFYLFNCWMNGSWNWSLILWSLLFRINVSLKWVRIFCKIFHWIFFLQISVNFCKSSFRRQRRRQQRRRRWRLGEFGPIP